MNNIFKFKKINWKITLHIKNYMIHNKKTLKNKQNIRKILLKQ